MTTFAAKAGPTGLILGAVAGLIVASIGLYASGWLAPSRTEAPADPALAESARSSEPSTGTGDAASADASAGGADAMARDASTADAVAGRDGDEGTAGTGEAAATTAEAPGSDAAADRDAAATDAAPGTAAPDTAAAESESTDTAAAPQDTAGAAETDGNATPRVPRVDIVRAEPDGSTVLAGVAEADSEIEVLLDGAPLDRITVDETGSFVSFLSLPPSTRPQVLSLRMTRDGAEVPSVEEVILAPPAAAPAVAESSRSPDDVAPDDTAAATAPAEMGRGSPETSGAEGTQIAAAPPSADTEAPRAAAEGGATDTVQPAPEPRAAAATPGIPERPADAAPPDAGTVPSVAGESAAPAVPQPLANAPEPGSPASTPVATASSDAAAPRAAPTVFLSTAEGIELLQSPEDPAAPVVETVSLEAITYEDDGDVVLTGRGSGVGNVRIYLDNTPVTASRIRADGRWRARLPDVATGTYTLRVDEVDAGGTVTSRVESPFLRESRAVLDAAAALSGAERVKAVTVQPGNTLWAIARDRYGEGIAYVRVFEANRDQIRDPDLIYPGQVFSIPSE
ncbi:LysM peptidoglycan-binding domain-containing protein [Thalassococcus profundi]|nr:LysM peptidoglycan-binding domain-containing protein [Thalassococcus profundi]